LLLSPDQVFGFLEQIGMNTTYIMHPEEILAENFTFLVQGKKGLPTPEILRKMKLIMTIGYWQQSF